MDVVDIKVKQIFKNKVVKKELTDMFKRTASVPSYVIEYLMGMYCVSDNDEEIQRGIEKVKNILSSNFVHPEESEKIKSKIVESESNGYTIIDRIKVHFDEKRRIYITDMENLKINTIIEMRREYVKSYEKLLTDGVWCLIKIKFTENTETPFEIEHIQPIQMASFNLEEVLEARKQFSFEEWETLILRSIGYEPIFLDEIARISIIERIIPLIEKNYNLCELGPRGTGKSHIYKEISPYALLMSGGKTTVANLFYNMSSNRIGLVGYWDCITFDEIAGMEFKDTDSTQILKDYMASGSFTRGKNSVNAPASIVFNGNIDNGSDDGYKGRRLFEPFPKSFNKDSAFFDRIHCYIPGWKIPKMNQNIITKNYGWITDYFSEFCKEMRKVDRSTDYTKYFVLNKSCNIRDEIAIRKTFSGLAKILFPGCELSKEECRFLLDYAIEGRKRVKIQLAEMAAEFLDIDLDYEEV